MKLHAIPLFISLALAGCDGRVHEAANEYAASTRTNQQTGRDAQRPAATARSPGAVRAGTPVAPADDRTSISEGPIDLKSAQGASQVMQLFGRLLEQREFARARMLWSDNGRTSGLTEAEFVAAHDKYASIYSEVGEPGQLQGAAGSVYVDIPLRLYGTLNSGKPFNLMGPVTLRRVNEVDGSTEEQRRWHIVRSGLQPRP